MRACARCGKEMVKRPKETSNRFAARRYCSMACGRRRGEEMSRSAGGTLTEEQVRMVRTSKAPLRALSEQLGVSESHLSNIRHRRAWAWVKD